MIERGELRLPEMQRQYVWRSTRVRDLRLLLDGQQRLTSHGAWAAIHVRFLVTDVGGEGLAWAVPRCVVTPPSQGKAAVSADKGNRGPTDFLDEHPWHRCDPARAARKTVTPGSRYVTVSDIQRETSAAPRPECPGRDHVFRSMRSSPRDETASRYERPPSGSASSRRQRGSVGERVGNGFALNDR